MALFGSSDTSINIVVSALDQASTVLSGLESKLSSMKKAFTAMQQIGTIGFAATAGASILAVKDFAETGKQTEILAQKTGFSASAISSLGLALTESGVSSDQMATGMKMLSKQIYAAEGGTKSAITNLQGVGISLKDIKTLKPEELFFKVAGKVADLKDNTAKLAEATKLFGRSGTDLLPFFDLGSAGIAKLRDENTRLGATFDEDMIKKAQAAEFNLSELQTAQQGLTIAFGESLAPALADLAVKITGVIVAVSGFMKQHPQLVSNIVLIAGSIFGLLAVGGTMGKWLLDIIRIGQILIPVLQGINLAFLANPVTWVVLGLVAIGVAFYELYQHSETFRKAVNELWDLVKIAAGEIAKLFVNAFNDVKNAIKGASDMLTNIGNIAGNVGKSIGGAISTVTGGTVKILGAKASGGWIDQTGPYLMHAGEYVIPSQAVGAGIGGQNIVVNITGTVDERMAQRVGDLIVGKLKRNRKI
jgi:hypothetical protein